MFNVTGKFSAAIAALSLLFSASCVSAEQKAAEALVDSAKTEMEEGRYECALALLDSVDHAYPSQIEARQQVTALRVDAIIALSEKQLAAADSIISVYEPQVGEFEGKFSLVPGSDGLGGYFVAKSVRNPAFLQSTGLEARVSDVDYSYYIVAVSADRKIGINKVTLDSSDGSQVSIAIPSDSPRVGDTDEFGSDLATFSSSESAPLGEWAAAHIGKISGAQISGAKGSANIKLSPAAADAIGYTWQFAQVMYKLQHAKRLHEKLERQLIIARDQKVNL